jgi:hypothetical protein
MRSPLVSATALALAALVSPSTARAQVLHASAAADVIAGIEGGGSGYASGVRRTRTMLRAGLEGYVDEQPLHWFGAGLLVELEPRASFGADLRYLLRFRENMVLHAGATAILAPDNLIGATVGYAYRLPLAKGVELNVNPLVNVFFLGGDLPKDTAIWQGTLSVGARIGLF